MSSPTQYDTVRYPGKFYPQSSPDRLATLATVHGLLPEPIDSCRVLELGCGDGGNLIPLADRFPASTFVGVDLSRAAVEHGNGIVAALELKNITLIAQDLMAFPADAGTFDYIIAHGILSWVPEPARQQMLDICARHLAPRGVAYLSYNTMPGGYLRNYPRDLMRFHTRQVTDPASKLRAAREIIDFVVSAISTPTIERELLKREMQPYEGKDYFLYHDLLADVNDPIYFLDFMDAASRCNLQFVSEANPHFTRTAQFPDHVRQQLDALPERLVREQYLDFINGRRFRQTILCRAAHPLDLEVTPERMERLLISSSARPVRPIADLHKPEGVEFRRRQGASVSYADAIPKALHVVLAESYPHGLRFSELRRRICERLGLEMPQMTPPEDAKLIKLLISSFANDFVELHVYPFEYCTEVSAKPAVSALVRLQAEMGANVVSANLATFSLQDGMMRSLVMLLDGTRDFQGLMIDLSARMGGADQDAITADNVHRVLRTLAANAMLVA